MQIGFRNLEERRSRGVVVDRAFIAHGIKYNKLSQRLFRLRQYALPFGEKETD